jgi:hypothetical protein
MAWYWYITGIVTALSVISAAINIALISGFMQVTLKKSIRTRINVVYDWADDSGPISRAG